MDTQNKKSQSEITPSTAIDLLKQGNERFVQKEMITRDFSSQREDTQDGQYPFAVILSCIDSRVPVETVFDLGIGDVFVSRVAGNIINKDILGSMEYSCKVSGSKLVLVLGHTRCGAIKSACDNVELGNITHLLDKIKPAVDRVEETGDRSSKNETFVDKVIVENVNLSIENIKKNSDILNEMDKKGEIKIVGGVYDILTGIVTFL
ncbi:carbonic anhydrase family protein [Ichthyobacterium seriolicida]|uniref:Carbonic anhydrase n=1 Tax=Ichthyobacterium seriolicida TaxID=242600 RepID=A0A1J1E0Y0_9FLAO|nr:carbonic anhydrase family protein [Ichthyobacterium seriolicida]BAV94597.1 carbonic anhydrase [Ichthyobacterium seriolicida]